MEENSAFRDRIANPLRKKYRFDADRYATNFLEKMALSTIGVERDAQEIVDKYEQAEVWMACTKMPRAFLLLRVVHEALKFACPSSRYPL